MSNGSSHFPDTKWFEYGLSKWGLKGLIGWFAPTNLIRTSCFQSGLESQSVRHNDHLSLMKATKLNRHLSRMFTLDWCVLFLPSLYPPRVSNFSPQRSVFLWLRGSNFRPLEDSGIYFCLLKLTFLTDSTMVTHHEKPPFGEYVCIFRNLFSANLRTGFLPSVTFQDKPKWRSLNLTPEMVT